MSYEVLARRWRPQTFAEVVGQEHVTRTLAAALRQERLPHAILLAGPRGVGKTSIARILARSLNCDRGPTEEPCGKCPSCAEIAASTSLDVQEIDAASHTGVENVRDIRDSIRYAPAPGKHRIFIIDEVHMLSQAAFNALLKTLEEPPPRSLFVFATTDPQKIPATVLSRVQRHDLRRIGAQDVLERLRRIAKEEEIQVPDTVLRALVREGGGSLRDALTLLDRLLAGLGTTVTEEDAAAVLDLVDRRLLEGILEPVLAGDAAAALEATRRALEAGVEPVRLSGELLVEIRNLVVARLAEHPEAMIDAAPEEVAAIRERAAPHDPEALQRLFRVLLSRTPQLSFAPHPEHVIEMAVVRLATLPGSESLQSLIARLEALEGGAAGPPGGASGAGGAAPPRPRGGGAQRAPEPRPRDPEREARARSEVKSHPAVRQVVEILDAEIREIDLGGDPAPSGVDR